MTPETGIYEYAKHGLELSADKTALWFYGRSISYRTLFEKIDNVADNLYALGVREGTVVTIHLPNCPQAVMAVYAVAKLGGICNMVHAQTPAAALRENMAFTESDILITYLPDCTGVSKTALYVDISHHMGLFYRTGYRLKSKTRRPAEVRPFEALERKCPHRGKFPVQAELAEKCAVYFHSSGSSGDPKIILLSHSALNNCVCNVTDYFKQEDVTLEALPLFHGFGFALDLHRSMYFGSVLVVMLRWNAASAVKLIKQFKVTAIVGVPTIFYTLLKEPDFCGKGISQLERCYVGGDTVDPGLIENFDNRIDGKHHLFAGYGLTETTTANCVNSQLHYKRGSSGYPMKNTIIAVMDEEGRLSSSGTGELVISVPSMMMGYLKDPEATEKALFEADGRRWTRTGDIVQIDEEGFLHFKDRAKNIIIHNGYNIYPNQLERVIRKVPGVQDVHVVGVFHEERQTQDIRAVVILKPGVAQNTAEEQIRQECLRVLPRYSVPREIRFTKSFPRNAMGKIDGKEMSKP